MNILETSPVAQKKWSFIITQLLTYNTPYRNPESTKTNDKYELSTCRYGDQNHCNVKRQVFLWLQAFTPVLQFDLVVPSLDYDRGYCCTKTRNQNDNKMIPITFSSKICFRFLSLCLKCVNISKMPYYEASTYSYVF